MSRRRDFGWIQSHGTPTHPAYSARWWEGGRMRRRRGFRTKEEAKDFLAMKRIENDPVAGGRDQLTIASVAQEWLKEHSAVKLRSHEDNVQRWDRIEEILGAKTLLVQVTPAKLLEVRRRLKDQEGLAAATVNRHLALLRTVLNHAKALGYIDRSPTERFTRGSFLLAEPNPQRPPPLASEEEARRLLLALREGSPGYFALFAFLVFTGARKGEAGGLRWEDVDLARRVVTIRRSWESPPKSGKTRTTPITRELAAILAQHRLRDIWGGPFVFPNPLNGKPLTPGIHLGEVLEAACKAAGVGRLTVHDLRHANASLWLMAGGTLVDVERNLGHSTPVITSKIYGHLSEDHRVREADRLQAFGVATEDEEAALAAEIETGAAQMQPTLVTGRAVRRGEKP